MRVLERATRHDREVWNSHTRHAQTAASNMPRRTRQSWRQRSAAPPLIDAGLLEFWLERARELSLNGRPHRAIGEALRVLATAGASGAGQAHAEQALAMLDALLPPQRSTFESMMPGQEHAATTPAPHAVAAPPPAGPTPAVAEQRTEAGVQRNCIYRIKAGLLLFRRGAPARGTALAGAMFPAASDAPALRAPTPAADSAGATRQRGGGPRLLPLPVLDADDLHGAVAAARSPHAVAVRHVGKWLASEAAAWTGETLAAEFGPIACHCLSAPQRSNRFTYYWGGKGDHVHAHYAAPPTVSSVGMPYGSFRAHVRAEANAASSDTLYLQMGLTQRDAKGQLVDLAVPGASVRSMLRRLRRAAGGAEAASGGGGGGGEGGQGSGVGDDDERSGVGDDDERSDAAVRLVQSMVREGGMGRYTRTSFFASCPGAITRLHYDHYDNLYLQLRGRKRFVLLAPLAARGVYPYPLHHPLDQRARVHLDAPPPLGASSFARLGEAVAYEIDLGPGELLFIPHHWWHHVETTEGDPGVDGLSLSLNLWFDFEPRLSAPPLPLREGLLVELSRHVEVWLGMLLSAKHIPSFLAMCATELAALTDPTARAAADQANAEPTRLPRHWLAARNLLFLELATAWVGWAGIRPFFDSLLHPGRFDGLRPLEGEAA